MTQVSQAFLAKIHATNHKFFGVKSPSEKRRLKRRLEERKRVREDTPTPYKLPAPSAPKPERMPEERKAIRATRRTRRINRKLKERQRAAAKSGLKSLDRRSLWPKAAPPSAGCLGSEVKRIVSHWGTTERVAEESHELSHDSRRTIPRESPEASHDTDES